MSYAFFTGVRLSQYMYPVSAPMLTCNHSLFVCGYSITGVPTKYNPKDSVSDEGPERKWTLSDVSDVTQKKSVSSAVAAAEKRIRIRKKNSFSYARSQKS